MQNAPVPHYSGGVVSQRQSGPLQRLTRSTDLAIAQEGARALVSAARIEGAAYIGDRLMTNLDRLRRHEAQSAADDPVVADEYAAVRRRLLAIGLNEMDDYGRRWP
jgi:hypothetical protein